MGRPRLPPLRADAGPNMEYDQLSPFPSTGESGDIRDRPDCADTPVDEVVGDS
jgi:hypothetical protein